MQEEREGESGSRGLQIGGLRGGQRRDAADNPQGTRNKGLRILSEEHPCILTRPGRVSRFQVGLVSN